MSNVNKILYVEDEPDIRAIAEIALRDIGGFTLDSCSSGAQAIEKAVGFEPDLILLDVMMPSMDGPKTLEELRKLDITATTPVIFMTAKVQPQEIEYYKSLGAVDVISKPFDPITLAQEIRDIMARL
ncbi:response regulator [Candidatus Sulfurimonas marisnigri]|uniref:Response regulator n=1 Tax=Candidatus Sulfurimonas marisnigri TaxID=2740405 RepID=A0A7S7M2T1_9BACT|nr:response regulator [Candidatus Sulfurimonas marisnigri]QOY55249.1 response regulator [Candidatus Sulfurimonas marisnigri]